MSRIFTWKNARRVLMVFLTLLLTAVGLQISMVAASAAPAKSSSINLIKPLSCKVSVPQVKLVLVQQSWVDAGESQSEFQGAVVYNKGTHVIDLPSVGYGHKKSWVVSVVPVTGKKDVVKTIAVKRPAKSSCVVSTLTLKKVAKPACKYDTQYIFAVTPVKKSRLEQKSSFVVTYSHKDKAGKTITTNKKLKLMLKDEVDNSRVFGIELKSGYKVVKTSVTYYHLKGKTPAMRHFANCLGK